MIINTQAMSNVGILEKLDILSFEKRDCEVLFLHNGKKMQVRDKVDGVYERGNQKVLKLHTGLEIDLIDIISVDGTASAFLG